MSQLRVFVSHSSQDNAFCDALVKTLRDAGADVWYDQHNLGAGELLDTIPDELKTRPVFIVILSKAAFASKWVRNECQWAFNLAERESGRLLLPVVAQPIEPSDFDAMLYLEGFKRIEAPGNQPYPADAAIAQTLRHLGLVPSSGIEPADVDVLTVQGQALNAQKRYQEAAVLFEQVVRASPVSFDAWEGLGVAYSQLGRWTDALRAAERATTLRADSSTAWSDKSAVLFYLNRGPEAWAACERALTLNPDNAAAWADKAGLLAGLKRYDEALLAIGRSIAIDPQDADAWANKGVILSQMKRPQEALVAFDRATMLDPTCDHAWGEKAMVLIGLKQTAAALDNVERAIAIKPQVGRHWLIRGTALARQFRLHEALAALDRALALGVPPEFHGGAVSLRAHVVGLLETAQRKMRPRG